MWENFLVLEVLALYLGKKFFGLDGMTKYPDEGTGEISRDTFVCPGGTSEISRGKFICPGGTGEISRGKFLYLYL